MKVVLAEKPSVAREIATFLGAKQRHDGYMEGGEYQVTWAIGHLVSLKEPDEYDPSLKKWSLVTLPFIPERFELKTVSSGYAQKQFSIVKRLFQNASELICATDAGREGELIFRYIQSITGCEEKYFTRLWLNSLTQDAIRQAFAKLKPGSDYDNLYAAARCRSQADWIVGMNATRNLTVRYGKDGHLWSAGRVQTPVLALIVHRDDEIRTFERKPFWELLTRYRDVTFRFSGDRFENQRDAESLLNPVTESDLVIHDLSIRRERKQPPQLYDLTELQRDMNRRYGMSAALTLKTAQTLYEKKLISYPRTDSRYLTSDLKNEIPKILQRLSDHKTVEIDRLDLKALAFSRRIVNNQKVNDHHAIIPTGSKPKSMSPWDSKVYDAIVVRIIAAFYPPCVSDITTVRAKANQVPFQARGTLVVDPGWTILYPRSPASKSDQSKQPDEDQSLPPFQSGERGPHQPFIRQGETKPPKHFTENTLLGVMETAGKLVDDEELKEALKDRGLGTPATRAATIETLLKRDYIERSKKTLKATNLGRYLIALVQDKQLKSAELTGLWEAKLKAIEAGHLDSRQFMQNIIEFTQQLITQPDDQAVDVNNIGDCPRCQREIIEGQRGFGCSGWRDGCEFVIWKKQREHQFEVGQIRELLQLGRLIDYSATGKDQESVVVLTPTGAVVEVPVPTTDGRRYGKKQWKNQSNKSLAKSARKPKQKQASTVLAACPKCDGSVIEQKLSYSCNKWRDGCNFVIWKNISGKRIGLRTAKAILEKGRSSVLKGFKSKAGNRFDARLVLDQGAVRLDFDDSNSA